MDASMQMDGDRLLTEAQVAMLTGRSKSALQKDRYGRRGIPFLKLRRAVRYAYRDVQTWMDEHRIETD